MTNKERECDQCGEKIRFKFIKKIRKNHYCPNCAKEIRIKHREKLLKEEHIADNLEDYNKESQKIRNKEYKERSSNKKIQMLSTIFSKTNDLPKIENSKKKKPKTFSYISKEEKQILFRKILNTGHSFTDAKKRTNELVLYLEDFRKTLKEIPNDEEAEINWREEFAKVLEDYH